MSSFRSAALLVLLAGCAGAPSVNKEFLTGTEKSTGTVILSATSTGTYGQMLAGHWAFQCESGANGKVADHGMLAAYIDGERVPIPISPSLQVAPDRPRGRIHILELPAGSCEFVGWSGSAVGHASTTSGSSKVLVRFQVPDKRTVYIGNFNVHFQPGGYRPMFGDYLARDMAALKKQSPEFNADSVTRQLARPGRSN